MRLLRRFFLSAVLIPVLVGASGCSNGDAGARTVMVYENPSCGCCTAWVRHLQAGGFEAGVTDMPDVTPMKERLGVPRSRSGCPTAIVGGCVVEGHVPADVVKRMRAEQPDVTGIAVPGMPVGSPGMEVRGRTPQPYEVVAFDRRGGQRIYATR